MTERIQITENQLELRKNLLSKDFATTLEGQQKIVGYIEGLRDELENKDGWKKVCELADQEREKPNDELVSTIVERTKPYIDIMPPGHDKGHFTRDLMTALTVYNSTKLNAKYQSDAFAGMIAGAFHDIGVGIIPRYNDRKFAAGHAEVGAWLFNELTSDILGENQRKLISYAIAAHSNYRKPFEAEFPEKYTKEIYFDEIWQEEGKLVGIAYKTARLADRSDTNGPIFCLRHIMAHFDSKNESAKDFSGSNWFEINDESLRLILKPEIRQPIPRQPTSLEHVINFKNSNYGNSVYSQDDFLFPIFGEILDFEVEGFNDMTEAMNSDRRVDFGLDKIESLFKRVSKTRDVDFGLMWNNFQKYWNYLTDDEKKKWQAGFNFCQRFYDDLIEFHRKKNIETDLPKVTEIVLKSM